MLGISKQAVSQYGLRQQRLDAQMLELIAEAEALRKQHPGCGVEKMYYQLKPAFIGRDKFIEMMMESGFRVNRPRNARRTTHAGRTQYANLIQGLKLCQPSIVWQSDITYIPVGTGFCYAVFIVDVYTKVIVGYGVSTDLRAIVNVRALKMAFNCYQPPLIHHSDRGSQYSSHQYVQVLKSYNVNISMGPSAADNAYAERLNRTMKEEYLDHWKPQSYAELKTQMKKAVYNYNHKRPHRHLNNMTPKAFEHRCLQDPGFDKPTITIFDNNKSQKTVNLI